MTRILLLGGGGQVGRELRVYLGELGELIAFGRAELDLADEPAIRAAVQRIRPELIVNAAAYTAVDAAEQDAANAAAINSEAVRALAEEAAALGARLVHYSTDYVFDGEKSAPYEESDATKPLGVYGASKLAGEEAIASSGAKHLILRTSGVYSHAAGNFVTTIRRAAATQPELRVVNDQAGSPTWARTIAQVTCAVARQWRATGDTRLGIYHLASKGAPTRHALAVKIVELAHARGETRLTPDRVKAIRTEDLPAKGARRPRYSALSSAKLERDFAVEIPAWDEDLVRYFAAADSVSG